METDKIQKIQEVYDKRYFGHGGSELEKIRHITLHVGKLLGKLSAYCEDHEDGRQHSTVRIQDEVVADLIFYAAQLANLTGVKLSEQYLARLENNLMRLHSGASLQDLIVEAEN